MKHTILAVLASLFLITLGTAVLAAPEIGKPAPDFTGADILSGQNFKLSDHKGKIVVLEWTNHECPFVKKHYDSGNMQSLQKSASEKGVVWVSIVSSAEGRQGNVSVEESKKIVTDSVAKIAAKILDADGTIGKLYDAKTTPDMFVIDINGNLSYAGAIDDNPSPRPDTITGAKNYVTAAIDDLLAGKPVQTPQTQPYGCSVKYAQ